MISLCTCNDLRLSVDDFFCGAGLPLLQLLPDAGDHTQVALQSVSHLRTTHRSQIFTCTPDVCVQHVHNTNRVSFRRMQREVCSGNL